MRFLSRCCAYLGVLVLAGVGSLAAPADAANPHLVSADATMSDPIVIAPGDVTWDTGLDVSFKVAGLGENDGLTATLTAILVFSAHVEASTGLNSITGNLGFIPETGLVLILEWTATPPRGEPFIDINLFAATATLTSDKNGNVTGTLTIPGQIDASIPDNRACVQVSWLLITLTIGSITVALPDVSDQFDSTGSFCKPLPTLCIPQCDP
jgi:hypothetical protein